jgi:hypothetical protein
MATTKKKKAATPVTGEGFTIRVLFPGRRIGVVKAREASEVFKVHKARTIVIAESRTMMVELPEQKVLQAINDDLAYLGLGLQKSNKSAASYEWVFSDPKKRVE